MVHTHPSTHPLIYSHTYYPSTYIPIYRSTFSSSIDWGPNMCEALCQVPGSPQRIKHTIFPSYMELTF